MKFWATSRDCEPARAYPGDASPTGAATPRAGAIQRAQTKLPTPPTAMIAVIGQGVPSANAPVSAALNTPLPKWIEPTSAEAAPARCGKLESAPATELATMKPDEAP